MLPLLGKFSVEDIVYFRRFLRKWTHFRELCYFSSFSFIQLCRLLHAPHRLTKGGSGGVLPRSGFRMDLAIHVAGEIPGAVSGLVQDQLQW